MSETDKNNQEKIIKYEENARQETEKNMNPTEDQKNEENKEQLQFKVSSFIEEAINTYKKENKGNKPKNLIIYRQGVSLQQKNI